MSTQYGRPVGNNQRQGKRGEKTKELDKNRKILLDQSSNKKAQNYMLKPFNTAYNNTFLISNS